MKCLIVDDEPLARDLLAKYVDQVGSLELVGVAKNGLEALSTIKAHDIDLVFLDIQMPDITGLQLIGQLPEERKPLFVLTTAYSEHALTGYELEVVDYLLKPISLNRFLSAVQKVEKRLEPAPAPAPMNSGINNELEHIILKGDKLHKVQLKDIHYIEGLKEYVAFYTTQGRIIVLQSLKSLEEQLPNPMFLRVHKSYIVNTHEVSSLSGNQLELRDKQIPVGKVYKPGVRALFGLGESS